MISSILSIIGFLLPILVDYLSNNKKVTYASDKEKFDQYITDNNASGMSAMFEQLLGPEASSGDTVKFDDPTAIRR